MSSAHSLSDAGSSLSSLSASQSAAHVIPAPPTFVSYTLPVPAEVSLTPVFSETFVASLSASVPSTASLPTSAPGVIFPSQAISISPPQLSQAGEAVSGTSRGGRVLTVGSIGQSSSLERSSAGPSLQSGVSAGQISLSASSSLVTPSPQIPVPFTSAQSVQTSSAVKERQGMNQDSAQTTNIFNPDNRLFPLGITAVALAGIFIAILVAFLIIRMTGCTRSRRNRYPNTKALPSFINGGDDGLSFHDQSVYRDHVPNHRGDLEKNSLGADRGFGVPERGGQRYPAFSSQVMDSANGAHRGWDKSQPPPHTVGVASTRPPRANVPPRQSDSGYTAYEQIFFPTDETPAPKGTSTPSYLPYAAPPGSISENYDTLIAAIRSPRNSETVQLGHQPLNKTGSGSPSLPSTRPLVLANPDRSRQATPRPGTPLIATTAPSPTHVQYRGFTPRTLRNSTSTISSFESGISSLSAYSDLTRATQMPAFKYEMPMPAFMSVNRGAGAGGDKQWSNMERGDRTESLDVPRDAVSRPGSGNVGHAG